MEQNTAILFADLSGYTALTETHGASTAADIIDTFLYNVDKSLAGDSKLHDRVGDEVLIISSCPDDIINTAIMLIKNCSKENHFLQLHGGLHYGKILERNNRYFGSPLNLASRISDKANKGTFWCSSHFKNNLQHPERYTFSSKGRLGFKNVSSETELLELITENANSFYIDPVCRMLISKTESPAYSYEQNTFFCSDDCRSTFIRRQNCMP